MTDKPNIMMLLHDLMANEGYQYLEMGNAGEDLETLVVNGVALSEEVALNIIREESVMQFDPAIVAQLDTIKKPQNKE